jgi:hypothetical protein
MSAPMQALVLAPVQRNGKRSSAEQKNLVLPVSSRFAAIARAARDKSTP